MDHENVRKKANAYFFTKIAVNAVLVILAAVLIALFLRQIQHQASLGKQRDNSSAALTEAVSLLAENVTDASELIRVYHDSNQDMVEVLDELLSRGLFEELIHLDAAGRCAAFSDIAERSGADYLLMMNAAGQVLLAPDAELFHVDPVEYGLLSEESVALLVKGTESEDGTVTPAVEQLADGEYTFYSRPFHYGSGDYLLILGTNDSVLKEQLRSLLDVSGVLGRASVGNGGFLFAVDTDSGNFLYCVSSAGKVLTGQNALEAGLSEEALADGYDGIQTVKGVRYYCVTKNLGNGTAVCAATALDNIYAKDRYVLSWSIAGFVMVMLLCLAYAVIVRNDFVRRVVETKKTVFRMKSGRTFIFDRSVFGKVFPLMALGVLAIFLISFYTQTLLEISQSIETSVVALDDATARYEESLRSRDIIQSYYDRHFLSKAKLLAYLIEEDPTLLNEPTRRYYSEYDSTGFRSYYADDEGNRLRSVSQSARLQALCEQNELGALYLINEDGRTIATSSELWYFTVDTNAGDQSYPFLSVLDGKVDSLVQIPMMSDVGELSQYIGVAFYYYTTRNAEGETVYVSRRVYLGEEAPVYKVNGAEKELPADAVVTEHRGLLQIAVDQELSKRLLASTDREYIFSSGILNGGFFLLFDNYEDHWCVYSPFPTQIDASAEELGIPANAFSGSDYYGFIRMNGEDFFQYFRYKYDYFIGTFIPRSSMYPSRMPIALNTAGASLLLILILSLTVTLTTEEEEYLYATLSGREGRGGLNNAIFDIILPSGKSVSTVQAAARWDNSRIPWRERSPEQKLLLLITVVCGILIAYLLILVIGARTFYGKGMIIRYILSGAWDRSLNIFALSACAMVLIFVSIAIALFRIPVRILTSLFGARSETIGHLLISVVKYGGTIGAIFYCLHLIGVDSTSLLASAGILSLVIGLGAQSLINDILAGIFIVFEGEFRVGDIITIDGFRGTVMDIGLRTTKVLEAAGNIKIFNNSDISGVLNMTKQASFIFTSFSIEYGQDIEYVEAVLARELPKLSEKNPQILEGPSYLGVGGLSASSVDLLIMAKCSEQDFYGVRRYLNKAVLQIFYDNGINVPFPNVTVSQLDPSGRKTIKDFKDEETKTEN